MLNVKVVKLEKINKSYIYLFSLFTSKKTAPIQIDLYPLSKRIMKYGVATNLRLNID